LDLEGKPLIAYSIEAALESKYIDKVVVSSDDSEILEVSQKFGATILTRPDFLATDISSTFDAIEHTIEHYNNYDYIVLLQPTSPLRTTKHIDESIELLQSKDGDAVISVTQMEHSPLWSNTLDENGSMIDFISDEIKNKRSQDLETYYRLNGAIYICQKDRLLSEKCFFLKDDIFAYKMDNENSIDIDEEIDFELAKLYMEKR